MHAHICANVVWPLLSHFGTIRYQFLWEIRRLLSFDLSWKIKAIILFCWHLFLGQFWREDGSCHSHFPAIPSGLCPPNPTIKLAHWVDLWVNCYLEIQAWITPPNPLPCNYLHLKISNSIALARNNNFWFSKKHLVAGMGLDFDHPQVTGPTSGTVLYWYDIYDIISVGYHDKYY